LQFNVKELILKKVWQQKIVLNSKRLFLDNDYTAYIMERLKAYVQIKVLKEKWIRYHTPYTKMRVYWDAGLRIYEIADEVAQHLNKRGIKVMERANSATAVEEKLNELLPWKCTDTNDSSAQHARERLREFRRSPLP